MLDEPREKLICAHCGYRHDRIHGVQICAEAMPEARIAILNLRTNQLDCFTRLEISRFAKLGLVDRLAPFYSWPRAKRYRDQYITQADLANYNGRDFAPGVQRWLFAKAG
jgi:hypothetical protein